MSTFISRRLFIVSTVILSSFIFFTAYSFAQETDIAETTLQQARPIRIAQTNESIADRIAEKRAEVKVRIETRKAEFSERVEEITNDAKRVAVERINTALETINENKTARWALALDRLSGILERIKTNLDTLEADGADVTEATTLVTTAEGAIADAVEAVEDQAEKTYTLEIVDEQTLGEVVRPVVQQFKQDLRTTLAAVLSARDAVRQAARGLSQVSKNQESGQNTVETNVITP